MRNSFQPSSFRDLFNQSWRCRTLMISAPTFHPNLRSKRPASDRSTQRILLALSTEWRRRASVTHHHRVLHRRNNLHTQASQKICWQHHLTIFLRPRTKVSLCISLSLAPLASNLRLLTVTAHHECQNTCVQTHAGCVRRTSADRHDQPRDSGRGPPRAHVWPRANRGGRQLRSWVVIPSNSQ
jgi:hypothetical protein